MTVALSGCVTDGMGMGSKKSAAVPKIAAVPLDDPMQAAPPAAGMDANGSRRVPLGQLAGNAQPSAAPVMTGINSRTARAYPSTPSPMTWTAATSRTYEW